MIWWPFAAAALDLLGIGGDLEPLAALLGLDHELIALGAGDEADHDVVVLGLDHGDAAAGALELGDLVGLAQQHVAFAVAATTTSLSLHATTPMISSPSPGLA